MKTMGTSLAVLLAAATLGCEASIKSSKIQPGTSGKTGAGQVYIPKGYRPDTPSPLIVTCHGRNPFDMAESHIREWKALADKHGCIVYAPKLTGTAGLLGDPEPEKLDADEKLIVREISNLRADYNIDTANVMLTGFSGAGLIVYRLGLEHPETFSAVVARSCRFNGKSMPAALSERAKSVPVLVYWGEHDPEAIVNESRAAVRWLRARKINVTTEIFRAAGHHRRPEVAMRFFLKNRGKPEGVEMRQGK